MSDNGRTTGKVMFTLLAGVLVVTALMSLRNRPASAHIIPSPCDFTTGGGFVNKDSGANASFGFVAGCKHQAFFGHVNYVDHETGLHVSSDSITGYTEPSITETTRRDICGLADTNLFGTVGYHVAVVDNGEPGINDRFGIALSNGYIVTTRTMTGGNIQIHKPNRSTTAPSTFTECSTIAPDPGP